MTTRLTPTDVFVGSEILRPVQRIDFGVSPRFDFDKGDFSIVSGNLELLTDVDNLVQWVRKALCTPRYEFPIYTWQFGNELFSLIGTGLMMNVIRSLVQDYITDALIHDSRIIGINDIRVGSDENSLLVDFKLITKQSVVVPLIVTLPIVG